MLALLLLVFEEFLLKLLIVIVLIVRQVVGVISRMYGFLESRFGLKQLIFELDVESPLRFELLVTVIE